MLRETETIEFKKSTAELKEAVISIAAMLNKHSRAEVYFGIVDDGTVLGQMTGRDTVRDVTQTVVDNIEPKVFPKVELRQIDGKNCIVVEAQGNNSPYFAYGRAYIRVGESDKALSVHEIETRILSKKKLLWESEISRKSLADVKWRADLSESRRKEIPEIPDRAISEAIGNSLCHRDYGNPMSALPQVSRLSLIGSRQVS